MRFDNPYLNIFVFEAGYPSSARSAHSADGLTFVADPGPLVKAGRPNDATGVFDPTMMDIGQSRYRMYYGTGPTTVSAMGSEAPNAAFARGDQVNFAVPGSVAGEEGQVVITAANGRVSTALARLSRVVPRLFPVALDARTFAPGPFRFAGGPLYIALFGTGIRNATAVSATVGGLPVPVLYAGLQPVVPGLDQVNLLLASDFPRRGTLDVLLVADGRESNRIRIALE